MKEEQKRKCFKLCSLVGGVLINVFSKPLFFWGNMSVYVMSYQVRNGASDFPLHSSWFIFMVSTGWSFGLVCGDKLTQYLKVSYVVLLGIALTNGYFFGSVFAVDALSWPAYILSFGFLVGFGLGHFECLVLQHYIVPWSDGDEGLLTSVYMTSASVGSACINKFITSWVNPENLSPNTKSGDVLVLTQPEVTDKLPSAFLVLGGINLVLQTLGFCLLKDKHSVNLLKANKEPVKYQSFESNQKKKQIKNSTQTPSCRGDEITDVQNTKDTLFNFLRLKNFHKLWFLFYALGHSTALPTIFYKVFSQNWIKDDCFLSDLGTAMSVIGLVSNIVWGMFIDRFGIKWTFLVMCTSMPLLDLVMYFSGILNKWVYFATTLILHGIGGSLHVSIIVSAVILFGNSHTSRNTGVLCTAYIAQALTISVMAESLISRYGWFSLFVWAVVHAIAAMLVVMFTLGDESKRKKDSGNLK